VVEIERITGIPRDNGLTCKTSIHARACAA
jgi:hypothetical protein